MNPVLEINRVSGGYGGADIIHDIRMHVDPGEIVAVVGPNGSGKSTVLRSVFGILHLSSGLIRLRGRDITRLRTADIVGLGICYVPQVANVFPSLSVEENLEMGGYVRAGGVAERIAEIYTLFPDLRSRRRQAAGTLSGGQRQMVAIGKALMPEPELLLLDEPTAGLSPALQGEVFDIVQRINAAGTPILMVEQNARRALEIARRGYVMVDGHKRAEGRGAALAADPEIARMFLGG